MVQDMKRDYKFVLMLFSCEHLTGLLVSDMFCRKALGKLLDVAIQSVDRTTG